MEISSSHTAAHTKGIYRQVAKQPFPHNIIAKK